MSALQLQRQLGITRYETAWLILHKLRRAMFAPERQLLRAEVEVDEAFVGPRFPAPWRAPARRQRRPRRGRRRGAGRGAGRVRLQVLRDSSRATLVPWIARRSVPARSCTPTAGPATRGCAPLDLTTDRAVSATRRPTRCCHSRTVRSPTSRPGCRAPTGHVGRSGVTEVRGGSGVACGAGHRGLRDSSINANRSMRGKAPR
jgi:hypothetical protein